MSKGKAAPGAKPVKERGRICGSGVTVSERSVRAGTWPAAATAAIVVRMTEDRTRHVWEPIGRVPIPVGEAP